MKRSSLAWYVMAACIGGSLCVGSVAQADSSVAMKVNNPVPTTVVTQVPSVQSTNHAVANDAVAQAALKEKQ